MGMVMTGCIHTLKGACGVPGIVVDSTVKTGGNGIGACLIPSWEIVLGHKHWKGYKPITDEEYISRYNEMLYERYNADPTPFGKLLRLPQIVIVCYCPAGAFCHRHLAAEMLRIISPAFGRTVTLMGEFTPRGKGL